MRVAVLFVLAALAGVGVGWGQPSQAERDREAELEAIRAEIARAQARFTALSDESLGLVGEIERTRLSLELQRRRLEEAEAARRLTEAAQERLAEAVDELEAALELRREALRGRLSELYRLGRAGYLRLFLSIRSRRELLPGVRALRYLARRDRTLLDRFLDTRAALTVERESLERTQQERLAWVAQESARHRELRRLERRQAALLSRVDDRRGEVSQRTQSLADKATKLENLLDFLAGRASRPLSGQPIHSFRGALDWPVGGTVVQGFGPRVEPRYGTRLPHNGIAVETRPGAAVAAVYPGQVVFAAPFEGYGQTVVVHHPGRVFSLYAGLSRLRVRQNDILRLGQAVGDASGRLYFEIRVENRPADPLEWLR